MESHIKELPPILVISHTQRLTIPQIPARSGPAIQSLMEFLKRQHIKPVGGMIYVYHGCNGDPAVEFDLDICVPIPAGAGARPEAPIDVKTLAPCKCVYADYIGPMSGIGQAWMNVVGQVRGGGHEPTDESREVYRKWIGFDSAENVTELQQGIV